MCRHKVGLILVFALWLVAPSAWSDKRMEPADNYPSDVAFAWFDTLYDVIKAEATAAPEAARIYGVAAVALYEAVVPGALHHRSLVGQLHDLASVPQPKKYGKYHWPTVANAALARTIRGLFPSLRLEHLTAIYALEQDFAAQFRAEVKKKDYERSEAHGQAVAEAILTWAASDGFSTVNSCPYVPNPMPGAWEPTPPGFNPNPLQPCWGQLRPMVLASGTECLPPGHPAFSTDSRFCVLCGRARGLPHGPDPHDRATDHRQLLGRWGWRDGHSVRPLDRDRGPARPQRRPVPGNGGRGVCQGRDHRHGCLHRVLAG